ncbi:MAG: hypothetical protein IJ946_00925 [Clostridia bacterium]|nr:hypothetical protein [Clostridia bacterium]
MKMTDKEIELYKDAFDEYVNAQELPDEKALEEITLSPEFEKKMESLLNTSKPIKAVTAKKVLLKAASVFLVCGLLVCAFMVGTFAELITPTKRVKDIVDIYNRYIYETEGEQNFVFCLEYIPKGYSEAGGGGAGGYSCDRYKNANGDVIEFYQYNELPTPVIDRFADVHKEIDGGLYVCNTATGESRYIISIYNHVFDIRADNLSREEVMVMAKGIKRLIIKGKDEL